MADSARVRQAIGAAIRRARLARRWSQAQLARALNEASGGWIIEAHYISRWERGERTPGDEWGPVIERVLELDTDEIALGLSEASNTGPTIAVAPGATRGLALDGAAQALESVRQRLDTTLGGPITKYDVEEWELAAERYAVLVDWVPAHRLLSELSIDLEEARRQVEHAPESLRPRMYRVHALLSSLAAISLVTSGYWNEANRCWRTAHRAGRLSGDRKLASLVNGRRAVFALYDPSGGPQASLRLAANSLDWSDGQTSAGTTSALAARTQGLALLGDRQGACATLVELERAFDRLDDKHKVSGPAWNWPETRLNHVRSFVYSRLGNAQRALAAQEGALGPRPRLTAPGAISVLIHRSMFMIASGDPVEGVRHLTATMGSLDPEFKSGTAYSLAEIALRALPEDLQRTPAVRDVHAFLHKGKPSWQIVYP